MKRILLTCLSVVALMAGAQTPDPVVMVINGKQITRGEFEYSYNKNGGVEGAVEQKTVPEYVDMFINYKLKVAAAESARLDTLSSFRREFLQYRDMQLTPYMVDQAYIDSVAHSLYDRTAQQLQGKDMLRPAHILLGVAQNATEAERQHVKAKADSLYAVLKAGGDFAALARSYSKDVNSGMRGGELPWIGPGMTLQAFEQAAYALQPGEISEPVLTEVGYHIIKMMERKQLEPYDSLEAEIIGSLKRQGIEDASAEHKIRQMVDASGGRLTREMVMDSLLQAHVNDNADLRYLVQEYHDGLLLYEISKREVWDKAAADSVGLAKWYKTYKHKYAWDEPRFKGFVVYAKDKASLKKAKKLLKKHANGDWRKVIKQECNKDSMMVAVTGPLLCKKGENRFVDALIFGEGSASQKPGFPLAEAVGKTLKKPGSYLDVKSDVVTDYQESLEKAWVDELRKRYTFEVDENVLKTVNNH